jgi:hypothetical protein
MRKIVLAALVVLPLGGFAVKAFAENGVGAPSTAEAGVTDPTGGLDPLFGVQPAKPGVHKRLSIKGIAIESEHGDAGEGSDLDD